MERQELGQKILNAFAIEGQVNGTQGQIDKINGQIKDNEAEIVRLEGLKEETKGLDVELGVAKKSLASLQNEYEKIVAEIEAAGASLPKPIRPARHLKF